MSNSAVAVGNKNKGGKHMADKIKNVLMAINNNGMTNLSDEDIDYIVNKILKSLEEKENV